MCKWAPRRAAKNILGASPNFLTIKSAIPILRNGPSPCKVLICGGFQSQYSEKWGIEGAMSNFHPLKELRKFSWKNAENDFYGTLSSSSCFFFTFHKFAKQFAFTNKRAFSMGPIFTAFFFPPVVWSGKSFFFLVAIYVHSQRWRKKPQQQPKWPSIFSRLQWWPEKGKHILTDAHIHGLCLLSLLLTIKNKKRYAKTFQKLAFYNFAFFHSIVTDCKFRGQKICTQIAGKSALKMQENQH